MSLTTSRRRRRRFRGLVLTDCLYYFVGSSNTGLHEEPTWQRSAIPCAVLGAIHTALLQQPRRSAWIWALHALDCRRPRRPLVSKRRRFISNRVVFVETSQHLKGSHVKINYLCFPPVPVFIENRRRFWLRDRSQPEILMFDPTWIPLTPTSSRDPMVAWPAGSQASGYCPWQLIQSLSCFTRLTPQL
jgi:hypothetical protein